MGLSGGLAANGGGAAASGGVSSFNTRTGAVSLSKTDVTGTGLAAADVGAVASAGQQYAVLAADLPAISASTLFAGNNITGLSLTIGSSATEMWLLKMWLFVSAANATMDAKFAFTVPTGCTMRGGPILGGTIGITGWTNTATANIPSAVATQATVISLGTVGSGSPPNGMSLAYVVYGGGTAGTVQPQYAQSTSDAGNLQILKGSCLEAVRLAI